MEKFPPDPAYLKRKAEECRQLAEKLGEIPKTMLIEIARSYERAAASGGQSRKTE